MDIEALERIRALKYRYLRSVDLKRWEDLGETLTEAAVANYETHALGDPLVLSGRAAIVGFMRENLANDTITMHSCGQHEIRVDGPSATGSWAMEDRVIVPGYRVVIQGAAYYEDDYARGDDGVWRIERTGYTRIYEALLSLDDMPSFRLLSNRWGE